MAHKRSTTYWRSKVFLICVFVLLIPTNYLGSPIQPKNGINNTFAKGYYTKLSISHLPTNGQPKENAEQSKFDLNVALLAIWISLILVLSAFLYIIILGYLNSRPLRKQCSLLYLYGDGFKLMFVQAWLWAGEPHTARQMETLSKKVRWIFFLLDS